MSDFEERNVEEHYSGVATTYDKRYDPEKIFTSKDYPAEFFRLKILLRRIKDLKCRKFIDMGLGEGSPAVKLASLGAEVYGFDYTREMVEMARMNFRANGLNPEHVIKADIHDIESFKSLLVDGLFDAAVCLGVMPHVKDDVKVLSNIRSCLNDRGTAFVSFRNSVFSMFTMNRYTHEFVIKDLLKGVSKEIREVVSKDLEKRVQMDKPPLRLRTDDGGVGYDSILSKFHNPFLAESLFRKAGFASIRLHWYHFHPAHPFLEGERIDPVEFRRSAIALEELSDDWRGHFLSSAYVVEAAVQ